MGLTLFICVEIKLRINSLGFTEDPCCREEGGLITEKVSGLEIWKSILISFFHRIMSFQSCHATLFRFSFAIWELLIKILGPSDGKKKIWTFWERGIKEGRSSAQYEDV